jgi:hypothetical protein
MDSTHAHKFLSTCYSRRRQSGSGKMAAVRRRRQELLLVQAASGERGDNTFTTEKQYK